MRMMIEELFGYRIMLMRKQMNLIWIEMGL